MEEKADQDLVRFLTLCGKAEVFALTRIIRSNLSPASKEVADRYGNPSDIPEPRSSQRRKLAVELVNLLRWFGSDLITSGINKVLGRPGRVHYQEILRDVAKLINGQLDKKDRIALPRVASVDELEGIVVRCACGLAIKDKTHDEIAQMFVEAGMEKDAARDVAAKFTPRAFAYMALPALVKLLGKRTVTHLVEALITGVVAKTAGKETAKMLAKRLAMIFSQRSIAWFIGFVGWLLLVIDAMLLASGPAKRITVPAVCLLSALRVHDRLVGPRVARLVKPVRVPKRRRLPDA